MRASAGLGGEDGVAGDEDEAEEVVADGVVEVAVTSRARSARVSASSRASSSCLRSRRGVAAEVIDGAVFGGGHEPGAGIVGDAGLRPLFEGGDEGVLGEVFGAGRRRG